MSIRLMPNSARVQQPASGVGVVRRSPDAVARDPHRPEAEAAYLEVAADGEGVAHGRVYRRKDRLTGNARAPVLAPILSGAIADRPRTRCA